MGELMQLDFLEYLLVDLSPNVVLSSLMAGMHFDGIFVPREVTNQGNSESTPLCSFH